MVGVVVVVVVGVGVGVVVEVGVEVVVGVEVGVVVVVGVGVGVGVEVEVGVEVGVNKCQECAKFKADTVNPKGGFGDCEEEKKDVLVRSWESYKGRLDWHWGYQKKLTYPGSEACDGYERRTEDNHND